MTGGGPVAPPLWIKDPLAILGDDAERGLVVERGRIIELVAAGCDPQTTQGRKFETFDASAHVVLPGLINAHHHFYQNLTRAHPDAINRPLFGWLRALYPVWAHLTPDMIALSSELALAELLLSGTTCASDHHYLFTDALGEALAIEAATARELGIRVHLTRGSMSLSEDDGGLPPRTVVQGDDAILSDCAASVAALHESGEGAMVQIALAPCSPFSVSESLMAETAVLARSLGVRLHTHLAETEDENEFCLDRFGVRPVDYLERTGWLGDDVWLAHGIFFDDDEIARLGSAGAGIAHCPSSNMVLASGVCPVPALEAAGVAVGLGVDGSASNDASNMIQEVRQALLLQKLHHGAGTIDHIDALGWATTGSARCLGRDDLGRIAVGKQADLALFRLDELRFSGAGDPLAALVLCGASGADAVMVGGTWRLRDGVIPGLDLERLIARHGAAASDLLAAAGGRF